MTDLVSKHTGQMSFAELVAQAKTITPIAVIDQPQLEKDKSKFVGVPHIITRVTYRPGVTNDAGETLDYVSCECIIADAETLKSAVRRGWIPNVGTPEMLHFEPEERAVYNDGSTGVRRRITAALHYAGLINVGEPTEQYDVEGDWAKPGRLFDKPFWDWNSFSQSSPMNGDGGEQFPVPDFSRDSQGGPFIIQATHGLRVSIEPKFNKPVYYLS